MPILNEDGEWDHPDYLDFFLPLPEFNNVELKYDDDCLLYRQLVTWCLIQRYRYYVLNDPVATDQEYDAIEREVRLLEESASYLESRFSPVGNVGSSKPEDYPTWIRSIFKKDT